jgi:hypothetical protein
LKRPGRADLALAGPDGYEDRAGSYSYDLFERSIGRNLYQLDPDISSWPPAAPCRSTLTVAVADPPHALVLWQVTASGKAIDQTGPWGDDYAAWSWAFVEPAHFVMGAASSSVSGSEPKPPRDDQQRAGLPATAGASQVAV